MEHRSSQCLLVRSFGHANDGWACASVGALMVCHSSPFEVGGPLRQAFHTVTPTLTAMAT